MNITESILGAAGGDVIGRLARNFGLDERQARNALETLLPSLLSGVNKNTAEPGGLDALLGALRGGHHQRYVDDPSTLSAPETIQDGNGILGHIFGSKERSREVAAAAANRTGIGADVLKKMLPVVAGLVMAYISKRAAAASSPGAPTSTTTSRRDGPGGLAGMLDSDRDGKVEISDVLEKLKHLV